MHRVEFTIEPFVEGHPGLHVTSPIDTIRALGIEVDVGPFGSSFVVTEEQLPDAVAAITREAFGRGATHLNIDITAGEATGS